MLFGGTACVSAGKIRVEALGVERQIAEARKLGAYQCAPEQLAVAETSVRFALDELAAGNRREAGDHLARAEAAASWALGHARLCRSAVTDDLLAALSGKPTDDHDRDGIPDADDACPGEPGTPEERGCPPPREVTPPDPDQDGIVGEADKCPQEPEDKDGFQDEDGCPDPDNDQDQVADLQDKCPNMPGTAALDGCPDPDPDKDGIVADADKCPQEPEDKDGFQDEDGCPDPDNDGDGLADADDACPLEHGPKDSPQGKGCPRKYTLVKVNRGSKQIEIKDKIQFAPGKASVLAVSNPILQQIAQVLKDNPEMKLSIEGHTDDEGAVEFNTRISQQRAEAVKKTLVQLGIAEARLTATGFGPEKPIASNRTARGRAANRRVEFQIVE